jgi:hypothetical protein
MRRNFPDWHMSINRLSLTPGFSQVFHVAPRQQPFQRLCVNAMKTVETVFAAFASTHRAEARC